LMVFFFVRVMYYYPDIMDSVGYKLHFSKKL